jgi:hypothetical protein
MISTVHRILRLESLFFLLFSVESLSAAAPAGPGEEEKRGADVFVTSRAALLRETALPNAKVVTRLPYTTRVTLLDGGDPSLRVEVPADSPALAPGGVRTGFLASETTAIFGPDAAGAADLLTVGRTLARNPGTRHLASAFLMRGVERLRQAGAPDPRAELLLAETAEALAGDGGPFPAGLEIAERGKRSDGKPRYAYAGNAFQRALDLAARQDPKTAALVRERALAGLLRAQFPEPGNSLTALWQETAGWLELADTAQTPGVLRSSADRVGAAALPLGRFLLAAGRQDDLAKIAGRLRAAAGHVAGLLPDTKDGPKLAARADVVAAMRGDGSRPFPQERRVSVKGAEVAARIDGEIGRLKLLIQTSDGKRTSPFLQRQAVPVLPVPGSLRVSPDGKSAAWIEVARPAALLPVMASLEKDEPAREIAFLASGRPLRDRALSHVVASVAGYSSDSRRLGLSIQAWDETPGPTPRLSVVSAETGELLFETFKDLRQYKRLLQ